MSIAISCIPKNKTGDLHIGNIDAYGIEEKLESSRRCRILYLAERLLKKPGLDASNDETGNGNIRSDVLEGFDVFHRPGPL
jgi:hypothetical protein